MMRLSTLRAIVETLGEDGTSTVADQILSCWTPESGQPDLGVVAPKPAHFFRASANFVFRFQCAERDYFLRFNHASERTASYIQAEIDALRHFAASGISVSVPVPFLSGNDVESVETSLGLYHATVHPALPGKQYETSELTREQFAAWGKALAELHLAVQAYTPHGRPTWRDHVAFVSSGLPDQETSARRTFDCVADQLAQLPITGQNFGLIHFDFELDNLLWDGDRIGIIDFDDCASYWLVADIAFALRDLFDDRPDRVDYHDPSFQAFVDGYRSGRSLSDDELRLIPLFLQMHNLFTLARLYRAVENEGSFDEPAWLANLRQKLHTIMDGYRASAVSGFLTVVGRNCNVN